jgi:hypothetical protein
MITALIHSKAKKKKRKSHEMVSASFAKAEDIGNLCY